MYGGNMLQMICSHGGYIYFESMGYIFLHTPYISIYEKVDCCIIFIDIFYIDRGNIDKDYLSNDMIYLLKHMGGMHVAGGWCICIYIRTY